MKYDRIFERNKLESSVDFLKNRSGSHSDRIFFWEYSVPGRS